MATHHFSRLLRLARRTGDRIIVTDEVGKEEPLVILPLDEYESLIDNAFGPDDSSFASMRRMPKNVQDEEDEDILGEFEEELDDIRIEHEIESKDTGDSMGGGVISVPDEAEIDENALRPLWEPTVSEKSEAKKSEEGEKVAKKPTDGEEGFYLESID